MGRFATVDFRSEKSSRSAGWRSRLKTAAAWEKSTACVAWSTPCAGIGRKVALVTSCDGFRIDKALSDAYFAIVEGLHARHYSQATRYAASAFMRAKLGGALSTRHATAAVFESRGKRWRFWVGKRAESKGPVAVMRRHGIRRLCDRIAWA